MFNFRSKSGKMLYMPSVLRQKRILAWNLGQRRTAATMRHSGWRSSNPDDISTCWVMRWRGSAGYHVVSSQNILPSLMIQHVCRLEKYQISNVISLVYGLTLSFLYFISPPIALFCTGSNCGIKLCLAETWNALRRTRSLRTPKVQRILMALSPSLFAYHVYIVNTSLESPGNKYRTHVLCSVFLDRSRGVM